MKEMPPRKTMSEICEAVAACRHERCKQVMRKAMTELVGLDGRHSYETLADLIDVEERTLKAYALGECLPSLPIFLRLCAAGGSEFTSQFLQLLGQNIGLVPVPPKPDTVTLSRLTD